MIKTIVIFVLTYFLLGFGQINEQKNSEVANDKSFDCSKYSIPQITQHDNKFILSLPRPNQSSGEPDFNKLTLVDSSFYNKYIKSNKGLFNEWNPNDMDGKLLIVLQTMQIFGQADIIFLAK